MRKYAWLAALLLAAGCADSNVLPGNAAMAGVSDILRVGDLVFITSANRSELRVLDTFPNREQNQKDSDYVHAPNPLKYLSIPVLARPIALHSDAWFDEAGTEMAGRYVFVRGSGASELSIVGAAREQLKELVKLPTQGPVTAVAAHGADGAQDSLLFYAENVAGDPSLQRVLVPPADQLAQTDLTAAPRRVEVLDAAGQPLRFRDDAGEAEQVISLLVLPRLPGHTELQLAVATRNVKGQGGHAYLLSLDAQGTQERADVPRVALDFGGPVRALFTHAAGRHVTKEYNKELATRLEEQKAPVVPAGARIFGVLDEAFCPSPSQCGLVAVDAIDGPLANDLPVAQRGQRSRDRSGHPMFPIHMGNTLVQGATIASGMPLNGGSWLELGGIATASDGTIAIFDAAGLQHLDVQGRPIVVAGSLNLFKADGMPVYELPDVRADALLPLASHLNGVLPGLYLLVIGASDDLSTPARRGGNTVSVESTALPNVRLGDQVELLRRNDNGQFVSCDAGPLTVTAVDAATDTLTLSDVIPENADVTKQCSFLSVRPATFEVLKDGVIRDQEIRLTYQGALPGLTGLPVPAAGAQSLSVPADLAGRVRKGDFLEFSSGDAACGVGASVQVVDVTPGATAQDPSTVTLGAPMPAGCTAYTVRAGTEKPWVMTGTVESYFGRVAPGARTGEDVIRGTPYFHPPDYREDTPAVDFFFDLPKGLTPEKGTYVFFRTADNFQTFAFKQAQDPYAGTTDFYLPGGVVFVKELLEPKSDGSGDLQVWKKPRVYIAYPSASALLEFVPENDPVPNSTMAGTPYR